VLGSKVAQAVAAVQWLVVMPYDAIVYTIL
jgi:hypothetical protein